MHIHNVYFWLKQQVDPSFAQGLQLLLEDPHVQSGYFGPPIASNRDVVDSSYSYGLVLIFADTAGHDAYQTGAPHAQFLSEHRDKWEKLVVYDMVSNGLS